MKYLLSSLLVLSLLLSSVFAATLTVSKDTLLKASPDTDSKTLLYPRAGETGPVIEAYGDYSFVTTEQGVKLAANGKSAKEGWVFRQLFTWEGDVGTAKVDVAISQGPYFAGHDVLIGAVPAGAKVKHVKFDDWWTKTTIRGVTGWIFRGTFSVAQ